MPPLSATISNGFSYYFRNFLAQVEALANDLSDEEFWTNPFPYGNSIGHLVLHLTGNLRYYIGAQLAATGYIRDRDREFAESQPPSRAEALQQLASAVEIVITVLETQTDEDWAKQYSAIGVDDVPDRFSMFLRCAVHFHHHIGHMSYVKDEYARRKATQL